MYDYMIKIPYVILMIHIETHDVILWIKKYRKEKKI